MRVKKLILICWTSVQANSAHNASVAYVYDDNIHIMLLFSYTNTGTSDVSYPASTLETIRSL